jgi:tetratricopeptide (TPR) repeat protein
MYCHEILATVAHKQNDYKNALKFYFKVLKTALRLRDYM